jgi:hypothetical protein
MDHPPGMDEAKYSLCLTHQNKLGHPSPSLVYHPAGMDDFGMCNLNDHIQAIDLKIVARSTQEKPCKLCKAHKKTILVEENVCPSLL